MYMSNLRRDRQTSHKDNVLVIRGSCVDPNSLLVIRVSLPEIK